MQMRLDRSQPVVAGQAAASLEAHGARRQVELVVHDHDVAGSRRSRTAGPAPRPRLPDSFM